MLNVFGRALRRRRALPVEGFFFGRPLVVLQSDDWAGLASGTVKVGKSCGAWA